MSDFTSVRGTMGEGVKVAPMGGVGAVFDTLGKVTEHLGGGNAVRAQAKMHEKQMAHEASMTQVHHENQLAVIDHIHGLGLSSDAHAQMLKQQDREHRYSSAAAWVSNPASRVRGGGRVDLQETAEGGSRMSFTTSAEKKPKPAVKKAAPKTVSPVAAVKAPAAPRARKTSASAVTEAITKPITKPRKKPSNGTLSSAVPAGEQYND
jgi:hypothetical protein